MKAVLHFLFITIISFSLKAETIISGAVTHRGEPVIGANVYLKNTYDGGSTNSEGTFSFITTEKGAHILIISSLEHEILEVPVKCTGDTITLKLKMKAAINELTAVNITAGAMEASDEKRSVVMKPIDIVTTSGAVGDIVGALNTLPGTSVNGADGRLFVRGGSADETAIFFDGLRVGNAFGSTVNGVPTRTRFNPSMFKGTFFSTGGYSAEYGQALSSVLSLETNDQPVRNQTDISFMTVGGGVSHTQKYENSSFIGSLNYTDLSPYQTVVPQNFDWERAPYSYNGELMYRHNLTDKTTIKGYYTHQGAGMHLYQPQPDVEGPGAEVNLKNRFNYGNLSFKNRFNNTWLLRGGMAATFNQDIIAFDSLEVLRNENEYHAKAVLQGFISNRLQWNTGVEYFFAEQQEELLRIENGIRSVQRQTAALFTEATYHLTADLALRGGLRASADDLSKEVYLQPRISAAYRLHKNGELSAAFGTFNQSQKLNQLWNRNTLEAAQAKHYILSYQYADNGRTIRAELFNKDYNGLLYNSMAGLQDNGTGYAKGFDLFYRDRKSLKNLDYWITYSFIDSKRQYNGFTEQVQPSFAPKHNISVVAKRWVGAWKSQIGGSWSWNDGYPFDNPNQPGAQESKTKAFSNLSLSWSYLPKPNLIIHAAVTNVLGRDNVFGYNYAASPNSNGQFAGVEVGQSAKRFFFIGVFLTLSDDKKANQLNNL